METLKDIEDFETFLKDNFKECNILFQGDNIIINLPKIPKNIRNIYKINILRYKIIGNKEVEIIDNNFKPIITSYQLDNLKTLEDCLRYFIDNDLIYIKENCVNCLTNIKDLIDYLDNIKTLVESGVDYLNLNKSNMDYIYNMILSNNRCLKCLDNDKLHSIRVKLTKIYISYKVKDCDIVNDYEYVLKCLKDLNEDYEKAFYADSSIEIEPDLDILDMSDIPHTSPCIIL